MNSAYASATHNHPAMVADACVPQLPELERVLGRLGDVSVRLHHAHGTLQDTVFRVFGEPADCAAAEARPQRAGQLGTLDAMIDQLDDVAAWLDVTARKFGGL